MKTSARRCPGGENRLTCRAMKVRAAVFYGPKQPFQIETLDLAEPRAGEVLVQVKATGVCHSDWHLMTGATQHPVPCVPGHEGAGIVEVIGNDGGDVPGGLKIGDHVALNWAPSCGECFYCTAGRPALCGAYVEPIWAGTMMDGTTRLSKDGQPVFHFSALACFAEYAVVPAQCCVRVPTEIPFEIAAVIGCAVTTGVGAVINTARIYGPEVGVQGAVVAVYGSGGVGLSAVMGAKVAGAARIIAIDSFPSKLERAREFGATDVIERESASSSAVEAIRGLTEGR